VSRVVRSAGAVLLAAAIALGGALPASAEPTAVAPATAATAGSADDPVTRFGTCLADGGAGDLVLLIDESGSLDFNDPEATRARAVSYLIEQLARFVDRSEVDLSVRFVLFSDRVQPLGEWTALNGASLPGLDSTAQSLAGYHDGQQTDYWYALEESRRMLADRRETHGGAACQAIAWFTDGVLEYDPLGAAVPVAPDRPLTNETVAREVMALAAAQLCNAGGLADQLRASDVITFAIGLDARSRLDFSLMEGIATGAGCGEITSPVPGLFTRATDIDGLLFAFDALSTPGQNAIQTEAGICQVDTCVEETHKFVLDGSTPLVHILASSEVPGLNVSLIAPSGEIIALEPKTIDTVSTFEGEAASASYSWQSPRTLSIDLSRVGAENWSGLWQLAFVDPAGTSGDKRSFSNVRISSDFRPAILAPEYEQWHRDDVFDLELGIVDSTGDVVDPATIEGEMVFTATLVDASGDETVLARGLDASELGEPVEVDLGGARIGAATVVLELEHTTADAVSADGTTTFPGTELEPQVAEISIPIQAPLDFPVIGTTVSFGVLEEKKTADAVLELDGQGCVWLDEDSIRFLAAPEDAGRITVTSSAADEGECLSVGAGPLPLTFTAESGANASVTGTIDVMLAPEGEPERAVPATVTFTADLRLPLDIGTASIAFIIALIVGIGLPVGIVYLAKFLASRVPGGLLAFEKVRLTVENGMVRRDGASLDVRSSDFTSWAPIPSGGSRVVELGGVRLLAKAGLSPASVGYVVVEAPGYVSASDDFPASTGRHQARLPLSVYGHWFVLRPEGPKTTDVEVVMMMNGIAPIEDRQKLAASVAMRLPDVLKRLDDAVGDGPDDEGRGRRGRGSRGGDSNGGGAIVGDDDGGWGGSSSGGGSGGWEDASPGGSSGGWGESASNGSGTEDTQRRGSSRRRDDGGSSSSGSDFDFSGWDR